MRRMLLASGAVMAYATVAAAHGGEEHAISTLDTQSFWNPATAVVLVILSLTYAAGLRRLWSEPAGRQTVRGWQAAAFFAGIASAGLALLSPLDRWSDVLFSAHMAQHEILMLVSAPLMVLARPFIVSLWAFRPAARASLGRGLNAPPVTAIWRAVSAPLTVLLLHAVVLWAWHVPSMFEAALHDEAIHVVQHLGFFLTAALFWWTLFQGRYGRIGYGIGVIYVFLTAMHTQILGALLTFDSRVLYPTHAARTAAAGGSPIADQQFAGILMWIPFGVIFVFVVLALFVAWLGEAQRRVALTATERIARESRS